MDDYNAFYASVVSDVISESCELKRSVLIDQYVLHFPSIEKERLVSHVNDVINYKDSEDNSGIFFFIYHVTLSLSFIFYVFLFGAIL